MNDNLFIVGEYNTIETGVTHKVIFATGYTYTTGDTYYVYQDSEYTYFKTSTNDLQIRSGATVDYFWKCTDTEGNGVWSIGGINGSSGTSGVNGIYGGNSIKFRWGGLFVSGSIHNLDYSYIGYYMYDASGKTAFGYNGSQSWNNLYTIAFREDDYNGFDVSRWLDTFNNSSHQPKGYLRIFNETDSSKFVIFKVSGQTSSFVSGGTYRNIAVSAVTYSVSQPGLIVGGDSGYIFSFVESGNDGIGTGGTGSSGTSGSSSNGTSGTSGTLHTTTGFEITDYGCLFSINSGVCNGVSYPSFDTNYTPYYEYYWDGSDWDGFNTNSCYNNQFFQDTNGISVANNAGTISWLYLNVSGECRAVCQIGDLTLKQALESRPFENIYGNKPYGQPDWTLDGSFILVGRTICNYYSFWQADNVFDVISYNTHPLFIDHNTDVDNKQGNGPEYIHLNDEEYHRIPGTYDGSYPYLPYFVAGTGSTGTYGLTSSQLSQQSTYVLASAGLRAQYLDSFKYSTTMTNKYISLDTTQLAQSPIGAFTWHDMLAFNRIGGTLTQQTTTNTGTTWSNVTLMGEMFSQIENQSIGVITSAIGNNGVRWNFGSQVQYTLAEWVALGFAWSASGPTARINIQCPSGTTVFTNTYAITQGGPIFCKIPTIYAQSSMVVEIYLTGGTAAPINMSCIKLLSPRWGDQGFGKELSYPYYWNKSGYIGVGTAADASVALTTTGFKLTTSPGAGKVLTSDTSGVGTWTTPTFPSASSGTTNFLPLYTSSTQLGNSYISQNGSKQVNINATTATGTTYSGALTIISEGAGTTAIPIYTYCYGNAVGNNQFQQRTALGTYNAPLALTSGYTIGGFGGSGHDGTTMRGGSNASITYYTENNWNSGSTGTRIGFSTTAIGSTTNTERMRLNNQGQLLINSTSGVGNEKLFVNGSTKFGSSSSYVNIDTDGTLTLVSGATVWDDLLVPLANVRLPASNAPTFTSYRGSEVLTFDKNQTNIIYFSVQTPHRMKEGTDLHFHMHMVYPDSNAGNTIWNYSYSWTNINGIFPTETTGTTTIAAPLTGNTHVLHDIFDAPGTGKTFSSIMLCSISRMGALAGDTYDNVVYATSFDFHYEIDSLGSKEEYVK